MTKSFYLIIAFFGQGLIGCPEGGGWVDLGESCYLISMEHFGWENAGIVRKTFKIVM